jgi:glutamine phosphoribosylpyrophosphate amidotransferase
MAVLDYVKQQLGYTSTTFDASLTIKINAAIADLGIAGVTPTVQTDPAIEEAVTTYVLAHWGSPDNYEQLKKAYDEQKAQLQTATGYTEWGYNI